MPEKERKDAVKKSCARVFQALRLKNYARMDFMMDGDGNMYCLEANTLPGMTPTSLPLAIIISAPENVAILAAESLVAIPPRPPEETPCAKAKISSVGELTDAMNAVLPHVSTSVDIEDVASVLGMVGDFKVTVSEGFPFDGMLNGGTIGLEGSCVVATSLEDNVVKLHELLFEDDEYEPTKELKSFSEKIIEDTQDYLQY